MAMLLLLPFLGMGQKEITQKVEGGELKGTLLLPKKKRNIPVVLIIPGSGPTNRDGNQLTGKNNALKYLAEALQKANIASLRIDKRGVGGSASVKIVEKDLRFDDYVKDIKGWLDLLGQQKRFNKIIVAGHSQGALVGMLAASKNKEVDAYISIAGPGKSIDQVITQQMEQQPAAIKEMVAPIIEELKKGNTVEEVPPMIHSLFRPSIQPYMISWMQYDPAQEIKQLKQPTLIVQGTTDIQVTVEDAELLLKAKPKAKKSIIKNMNHVLKEVESTDKLEQMKTYADPELDLHPQVGKDIVEFITQL